MFHAINIEILRLKQEHKYAILLAFIALLFGAFLITLPGAAAQYASAETDRHVFVFDEADNVGISITENQWWIDNRKDGLTYKAGTVNFKEPKIKNTAGDCYMRAIVRITDDKGNPLDPESRSQKAKMDLVMRTLWSDSTGSNISLNDTYTKQDLENKEVVGLIHNACDNSLFEDPVYNDQLKAYVMNYKANKGIFKSGEEVTLFNRVVIPTDYEDIEIQHMGKYYVVVWAQAIQSKGFSDATSALERLSNAYVATDLSEVKAND